MDGFILLFKFVEILMTVCAVCHQEQTLSKRCLIQVNRC